MGPGMSPFQNLNRELLSVSCDEYCCVICSQGVRDIHGGQYLTAMGFQKSLKCGETTKPISKFVENRKLDTSDKLFPVVVSVAGWTDSDLSASEFWCHE